MALDLNTLVGAMTAAAEGAFGAAWRDARTYAIPELNKIAIQILAIEEHKDEFTPDGAKALLAMQVTASQAVIVAMTTLVLVAVQQAINQILGAIKGVVNQAIGFPLI